MTNLLSDWELEGMRDTVYDVALPDKCTILSVSHDDDGQGGTNDFAQIAYKNVHCRLDAVSGSELITAGKPQAYHSYSMTVPYDQTIDTNNLVLLDGQIFSVISVDTERSWLLNKQVRLEVSSAPPSLYEWYVDSVDGLDTNNGTSSYTAFKTIAKLLTVLATGEKAGLARGSHWREQLTVTANNIGIYGYGIGADPILDCSDIITAVSWSKTGGQTYVYQATLSPALGVNTWNSMWEDDTRMVRATSIANCDATSNSYYPSSDSTAPITMYIHASDGSDPGASGKVYEYAARLSGVYSIGYTGITVKDLHTERNLHESGSLLMGDSSTITDCLCEDGSKHNLYYGENSVLTNVTARNAYYTASLTYFVGYKAALTGGTLQHINCRAENTTGVLDVNATAFYFHGTTGSFGAVTYQDCYCNNMLAGIDTAGSYASLTIDGFECVDVEGAVAAWHGFTLTGLTCNVLTNKRAITVYAAGVTINLNDSTITLTGTYASGGLIYSTYINTTINLDGVHFIGQNNETCIALYGASGNVLTQDNCDFESISRDMDVTGATVTSDYNRFRDAISFVYNGSTYNTVALWQAGTGQDAHSTVG